MGHALRRETLARWVPRFAGHRIAVIGDPVLDVYLYGMTHRISREAPVLIVREDTREHRLGGAANTAANLAALGVETSLVGLVGADDDGSRLIELATGLGISTARTLRLDRGCTVTKTRVLAGGLNTTKQQMLRIDRENDEALVPEDAVRIRDAAREIIEAVEAIVISDYGNGGLTPTYVEIAREARRAGRQVIVDSRRSLRAFKGATAVTPNEPEAEGLLGAPIRNAEEARRAARQLREELDLDAMLLTRGREGMAVAERARDVVLIPAHGGEAVDVTGAGDTVVSTFTAALAAGAPVLEAAVLANCAASVVVRYVGAATCSPSELTSALEALPE